MATDAVADAERVNRALVTAVVWLAAAVARNGITAGHDATMTNSCAP